MARGISNLPSGWVATTVERVGAVRLGRQRSPEKHSGQYPTKYLRAANITPRGLDLSDVLEMDFTPSEQDVFALQLGDVVLAEASGSAGQVGRAAVWQNEIPLCCFQNTVIRFRAHAVSPEYAHIVFRHFAASGVFAQTARGVGIQHLGALRFAQLPFPLPPWREQSEIVAETERRLTEIRAAIYSLESALLRVGEQRRSILASAVVGELIEQGADTTADAERELPDRLLSRAGAMRQPSLFEATEQVIELIPGQAPPDLPPNWTWARIDEVGDIKLGASRNPDRVRSGTQTPYLRVANVQEDMIDFDDLKVMGFSEEERNELALQKGDILLNVGQSPELVGRPALIRTDIPLICFQNHLARFRPKSFGDSEYALIVFRHYLHAGVFRAASKWSTNLATLSLSRLGSLPFPLPPVAEQRQIAAAGQRRLQACDAQEQSIRASLPRLPKLEAEILAAAVGGMLVPQDPTDEPATDLLDRLGEVPPDRPIAQGDASDEGKTMAAARSISDGGNEPGADLTAVLREAAHPVRLPDLFLLAGYDRDSVEHVEQFYLTLRQFLGSTIRVVGDEPENGWLEAIPDEIR